LAAASTQVVAGLPADLVAKDLDFAPDGQIHVTLANQGKTAVNPPPAGAPRGTPSGPPIQVDVYLGTTKIQTLYQQSLAGNTSRVLKVQLQSNPPGCGESRPLRAVVDPQKVIAEGNDANNDTSATPTRDCPDLAIKDIERDYSGVFGETYSVKVTIVNKGTAPAPAHQAWATSLPTGVWPVTGWPELVPTEGIPELDPGETKTFHVGGSVLATSRTAVRIVLDRHSEIAETDESNNFKDEWL
jgi:subtilase family serine protease